MHIRDKFEKPLQREVDKVLSRRSTGSRARAAYDLWLKINPMVQVSFEDGTSGWLPAKRVHNLTVEKVNIMRDQSRNKFATNESRSMRQMLEMPPAAMHFIQMFHPDLFDGTVEEQKMKSRKLYRAFPEFQIGVV